MADDFTPYDPGGLNEWPGGSPSYDWWGGGQPWWQAMLQSYGPGSLWGGMPNWWQYSPNTQGQPAGQQGGGMFGGDTMKNLLLASALGLGGLGLFGGMSDMFRGRPTQTTKVGGASPEEQQSIQQALAQAQQSQQLLNTLTTMMLSGNLGLSPEMNDLVKQSFQGAVGDTIEQAIESARGRGFQGGPELLGTAAAPIFSRLAAQIPGQMAQAKLNLGMQVPQIGAQLAQGYGSNAGLLSNLAGMLGRTRSQTMTGAQPSWLSSLGPLLGGMGGLFGGLGAMYGKGGFWGGSP